jgi:hypothetical protein
MIIGERKLESVRGLIGFQFHHPAANREHLIRPSASAVLWRDKSDFGATEKQSVSKLSKNVKKTSSAVLFWNKTGHSRSFYVFGNRFWLNW